jgi:methylated-DNA-[protein]-cysteine S-methyltransferase
MKSVAKPEPIEVTPFQRRVYECVRRIPAGRVSTYGAIAAALGHGSARAVGQALRRNPFAPRVPCHRVIASDGSPGGFVGERVGPPLRRKLNLLASEGVTFREGRLADKSRLFSPPKKGMRPPSEDAIANP